MTTQLIACPKEKWISHETPRANGYYNELTIVEDLHEMDAREPLTSAPEIGELVVFPFDGEWNVVRVFSVNDGNIQRDDATYQAIPARYFYTATQSDLDAYFAENEKIASELGAMIERGNRAAQFLHAGQIAADRDND